MGVWNICCLSLALENDKERTRVLIASASDLDQSEKADGVDYFVCE